MAGASKGVAGSTQSCPSGDLIPKGEAAKHKPGLRARIAAVLQAAARGGWRVPGLPQSRGGNRIPMFLFCRLAMVAALGVAAAQLALAQDPSSSSSSSTAAQAAQPQDQAQNQGSMSVQQRIRERRLKRRAAAIKDVYSHLYEFNTSMGYLRFVPGP